MIESLINLEGEDGIQASGKDEVFGCIFGRDSAITILKILSAYKANKIDAFDPLLRMSKKTLFTLSELQGKEFNSESGEQVGKCIHEFRKDKYERLINRPKPWYVYPDGILRNYDSIDSTPLFLIAVYKFFEATKDGNFLIKMLPSVELGLNWIISYGDMDKDYLLEYDTVEKRKFGGLVVQSWTDSHESLRRKNGEFPLYPIAPVEVQGYAWLALKLWADYYKKAGNLVFANKIEQFAKDLKKRFNDLFILKDNGLHFAAQALDGAKNQIETITANPILLLWAVYENNGLRESILEDRYVDEFVERVFQKDMFSEKAGVRTMSALSPTFNGAQNSYHNGSYWPKVNGMIYEALKKWGFNEKAIELRDASLKPIEHFKTPIELYVTDENGSYFEFQTSWGKRGCKQQAWSAAAILDMLSS